MALTAAAASLIGSGIGAAGSLGSSFLGQAFTAHNMHRQYKYQSKLQKQAAELNYQYSLNSARNLPSAQRQGLETAGYNPLLALDGFSAAGGFTSAGSAGLGSSSVSDIGSGVTDAYRAFSLEKQNVDNATKQTEATVRNLESQSTLAAQQAKTEEKRRELWQSQMNLNFIDSQLKSKELSWYDRRQLTELRSMEMNAISSRIGANAAMSQAGTARDVYNLDNALHAADKKEAAIMAKFLGTGAGEYGVKYDFVRNHYPNPGNVLKFGLGAAGVKALGNFDRISPLSKYQDRLH